MTINKNYFKLTQPKLIALKDVDRESQLAFIKHQYRISYLKQGVNVFFRKQLLHRAGIETKLSDYEILEQHGQSVLTKITTNLRDRFEELIHHEAEKITARYTKEKAKPSQGSSLDWLFKNLNLPTNNGDNKVPENQERARDSLSSFFENINPNKDEGLLIDKVSEFLTGKRFSGLSDTTKINLTHELTRFIQKNLTIIQQLISEGHNFETALKMSSHTERSKAQSTVYLEQIEAAARNDILRQGLDLKEELRQALTNQLESLTKNKLIAEDGLKELAKIFKFTFQGLENPQLTIEKIQEVFKKAQPLTLLLHIK